MYFSYRRIKEKLLNFFEYKDGQKHVPGILVKEFTRSAADAKVPRAKDMRTERCLMKTVEYLLKELVNILLEMEYPTQLLPIAAY